MDPNLHAQVKALLAEGRLGEARILAMAATGYDDDPRKLAALKARKAAASCAECGKAIGPVSRCGSAA